MSVRVIVGDALTVLRTLESESVQMVCTSPPYLNLRSYLPDGHPDKDKEIGLHDDPADFVDALVDVFREVKRVLHPTGTLWLNLGFSYAGSGKGPTGHNGIGNQEQRQGFVNDRRAQRGIRNGTGYELRDQGAVSGFKPKDLMLMPFFVAEALRQDGWYLRSVICWAKKSAMPESVSDRPTNAWEPIFLLSKSRSYFYDAEAVKEPQSEGTHARFGRENSAKPLTLPKSHEPGHGIKANTSFHAATAQALMPDGRRNMRNVWTLGPEPFAEAHFATFVSEIPRRCILAGTSEKGACPACGAPWVRMVERIKGKEIEAPKLSALAQTGVSSNGTSGSTLGIGGGGHGAAWAAHGSKATTLGWQQGCRCPPAEPVPQTVLDPFGGSGTVGLVAERLGRDSVLVELNPEYAEMARKRIATDAPMLTEHAVAVTPAMTQADLFEVPA